MTTYTVPCIAYYFEKIALPSNSTLYASLEDISVADLPSKPIASCVIEHAESAGLGFELLVPASAVIEGHSYAIQARIEANGELMFTTTESHHVEPGANYLRPIEVLLHIANNGGQGSNVSGGQGSNSNGGQGSNVTGGQGSNSNGGQGSNVTGGQGSNSNGGQGSNVAGA
ncbi:YbaY family lipoprotein [Pseudomonas sp. SWRI92]|uniref:YbaY family lipoprotein n=1 Tax=Pseudomonas sp. SWRI92 TaxID=2745499 RepID=UPI001644F8C3|nr:YbaY family lipoprotein [Pseudomonas sp. SWRI92]MBC3373814.1 YbaY family lipoprotein [Pseudomonas sp. SWRI92]